MSLERSIDYEMLKRAIKRELPLNGVDESILKNINLVNYEPIVKKKLDIIDSVYDFDPTFVIYALANYDSVFPGNEQFTSDALNYWADNMQLEKAIWEGLKIDKPEVVQNWLNYLLSNENVSESNIDFADVKYDDIKKYEKNINSYSLAISSRIHQLRNKVIKNLTGDGVLVTVPSPENGDRYAVKIHPLYMKNAR